MIKRTGLGGKGKMVIVHDVSNSVEISVYPDGSVYIELVTPHGHAYCGLNGKASKELREGLHSVLAEHLGSR